MQRTSVAHSVGAGAARGRGAGARARAHSSSSSVKLARAQPQNEIRAPRLRGAPNNARRAAAPLCARRRCGTGDEGTRGRTFVAWRRMEKNLCRGVNTNDFRLLKKAPTNFTLSAAHARTKPGAHSSMPVMR
jgi:hypothetical protein